MTVGLAQHLADIQKQLNIDAKPYVAAHLKKLFDSPPAQYYASASPLTAMFSRSTTLDSILRQLCDVCDAIHTAVSCSKTCFESIWSSKWMSMRADASLDAQWGTAWCMVYYSHGAV